MNCPTCHATCEPWMHGGKRKMLYPTARPRKGDTPLPASVCVECGAVVLEKSLPSGQDRKTESAGGGS